MALDIGLSIIESQSVGRPVVTSNIMSMPEVAGNSACLVDPYSVVEIRKGVLKVISNSGYRDDLVKAGLNNIMRFSVKDIASQYELIYQEILDNYQKLKK